MSDAPPPPNSLPPPPSSWLKKPKKKAEPAASGADAELAMMLASLQVQLDTQSAVAPRRRKLLVLDVNGLLLWRVFKKGQVDLAKLPPPDATMGQFLIFARPHLREFLTWCAEHFYIVVWSTTTRKNLDPIVKFAFEGLPPPSAVLDQTDCTDTGVLHPDDTDGSYKLRIKELSKLWADARIQSALGSDYGPSDTILLDDSPYKAVANPEHTALHPKSGPDQRIRTAKSTTRSVRAARCEACCRRSPTRLMCAMSSAASRRSRIRSATGRVPPATPTLLIFIAPGGSRRQARRQRDGGGAGGGGVRD